MIYKDSKLRVSCFPLVNFVEIVESQNREQNVLKIKALQKSRELVLKIGPIGVPKFGSAEKLPYLCGGLRKFHAMDARHTTYT